MNPTDPDADPEHCFKLCKIFKNHSAEPNKITPHPRILLLRDIQRLPTTTFSLVLRKEYFDCPQRDYAPYITFNRGGRGESVLLYSVVLLL
jgi:hypothetical protein